ncbi:hypothetical protein ACTL6U_08315 [Rhodovibrionaceae bacterium A322]
MTSIAVFTLNDIQAVLSEDEVLQATKGALIAQSRGEVISPPPGMLQVSDPEGECHIKYGHVKGTETFAIKIATGFYDNPRQGLPASSGLVVVVSAKTGVPLCLLDDKGWLTNVRTAAAGALAAQAGAPDGALRLGIVGTGEQAELQARWTCRLLGLSALTVWGRSPTAVESYAARMEIHGITVAQAADVSELMACCNLVITTTPATSALISADVVRSGTHIVAMGCDNPGKQELAPEIFASAGAIMVDDLDQCVHHGDFSYAVRQGLCRPDAAVPLGAVLAGQAAGRSGSQDITVVDLTGIAAEDLALATLVWQRLGKAAT